MSLEYFYTLPSHLEDRVIWKIDPQLRDRIFSLCQIIQQVTYPVRDPLEAAIARYLFEQFQQHPESEQLRKHWLCFLAHRCEKVANRILPNAENYNLGFQDLFQMASLVIVDPRQFFERFDETHVLAGWYPTLIKFSDKKIKHFLLPQIRSVTGSDMFGRSNLGIAARSSRTRVLQALKREYSEPKISQYHLLAWDCFQEYRPSVSRSVDKFNYQDFQNIAARYNELREEDFPSVSGSEIQIWLDRIGEAIRRLLDPQQTSSFWSVIFSHSDEEINVLENIPFETSYDPEMDLTVKEFREAIAKVLNGLQELQEKQMLFLSYGLKLSQAHIGSELGGIDQSTVSRHLAQVKDRIFSEICDWVRNHLQRKITAKALTEMKDVLGCYFSQKIDRIFQKIINSLDNQSVELLRLYYCQRRPASDIGNILSISKREVSERLKSMQQKLSSAILEQIQQQFNLKLEGNKAAQNKISQIVDERLERIYNFI